jgi:hypothetical protein
MLIVDLRFGFRSSCSGEAFCDATRASHALEGLNYPCRETSGSRACARRLVLTASEGESREAPEGDGLSFTVKPDLRFIG